MEPDLHILPQLIIIFGLPGTGKTTIASALSTRLGWVHFNTDMIRTATGKRKQYDDVTKASVYREMLSRTSDELNQQRGVILDGTFYMEALRAPFRKLAKASGVSIAWIEMVAPEAIVRTRVSEARPYSEADFEVYQKIRNLYEPLTDPVLRLFSETMTLDEMLDRSIKFISQ